jgi:hypothetical protein
MPTMPAPGSAWPNEALLDDSLKGWGALPAAVAAWAEKTSVNAPTSMGSPVGIGNGVADTM